jgi:hypothetical protein
MKLCCGNTEEEERLHSRGDISTETARLCANSRALTDENGRLYLPVVSAQETTWAKTL